MKEKEEKMHFPKIDDFFTTQEERDEQKLEKVEKIAVSSISNFPNHPYQVKENEEMEDFVENVKEKGIIHPVIVRPKKDGTLIEEKDSVYCFEFENTEIEVPNTGDNRNTKIFIIISGLCGISFAGIIIYDYKKKKKTHRKKK